MDCPRPTTLPEKAEDLQSGSISTSSDAMQKPNVSQIAPPRPSTGANTIPRRFKGHHSTQATIYKASVFEFRSPLQATGVIYRSPGQHWQYPRDNFHQDTEP